MPGTTVLGIGNTLMGDDGLGAAVAHRLAERDLGPDVEVVIRPNAEMGLVRYFLESERVIVIDAIDTGAEPGAVFRFTPDDGGLTSLRSNNIHGMGVGYLVTNARLSGADPEVIVYGIQVADVRPRPDELTPAVRQVVDEVADMIASDLRGSPPTPVRGITGA